MVNGTLDHIDDFAVSSHLDQSGKRRFLIRFAGTDDVPKVELHDPMKVHTELLKQYTDAAHPQSDCLPGDVEMNIARFALVLLPLLLPAQMLDPSLLLKQPTDAWPTYNGDYSGRRFSTLNQINQSNIGNLKISLLDSITLFRARRRAHR